MQFYDMLVLHDPKNKIQGDCLRACIATLLQLEPSTMPHFVDDPINPNWIYSLNSYLKIFDLWFVYVPNQKMFWSSSSGAVYHLLIGPTVRGTKHAVVGCNGKMIHDPHPSRTGLVSKDEYLSDLFIGLLVKRFKGIENVG